MSGSSNIPSRSKFVVSSPFDSEDDADFVLRASGGEQFFVYRSILSVSSPVFRDMLSWDTSQDQPRTLKHPVVQLSEDCVTIDTLLRICYPVRNPSFKNFSDVDRSLRAANKYQMDYCVEVIDKALSESDHELCRSWNEIGFGFTIACRWDLKGYIRKISTTFGNKANVERGHLYAHSSFFDFDNPYTGAKGIYYDCMHDIPAGALYRLLKLVRNTAERKMKELWTASNHYARSPPRISFEQEKQITFHFEVPNVIQHGRDVTLKSCDGITFFVHSHVISASSALFEDIDIPNLGPASAVDVPIDAITLSFILHVCYHEDGTPWTSFDDLGIQQAETVFLTALRLKVIRAREFMASYLRSSIKSQPMRAFLVAARFGLDDVTQEAAVYIAQRNLAHQYHPEMEKTEAKHYYALLEFDHEYKEALLQVAEEKKLIETAKKRWSDVCEVLGGEGRNCGPDAALQYVMSGMKKTARSKKVTRALYPDEMPPRRSKRVGAAQVAPAAPVLRDKLRTSLNKVCTLSFLILL